MGDGDWREMIDLRDRLGIGERGQDLWREARDEWPVDGPDPDEDGEDLTDE